MATDVYEKASNFIDLKINGRLFPSWILLNFKKYKLPPIVRKENEDPCNVRLTKKELHKYQQFISAYLDYKSPHKDILIYHGLGSGKTVTAINVYNMLYNYTPAWNVFILIKASLKNDPWLKDIEAWLSTDEKQERFNNIKFIHYDSPFADRDFIEAKKSTDNTKKMLYIIDEVHNFIKNVYNNINTKKGKRAHVIYDYILQDKKEDDSTRILLLSGTPAVNNPYELALIFNLMRPDTFPKTEAKFNELYITSGVYRTLNPERKNLFQRRIMGLVSYYIGATPDLFASRKLFYKNLVMDKYQQEVYQYYEDIEAKLENARRRAGGKSDNSVYRAYTRQACNFVFPAINDKINGEARPRPGKFRLTEREMELVDEGKNEKLKMEGELTLNVTQYIDAINNYLKSLISYWEKKNEDDIKKGNTLEKDIEIYKKTYKMKFSKFWDEHKNKSSLLSSMYSCSAKMTAIIFYLMRSPGSVLVYSNYVKMEGLEIFKIYLKFFGYSSYNDSTGKDYFRYGEYHGGIKDRDAREKTRKIFNDIANKDGKIIKIILISPAGSEGINLANVRQVHIMEPYWNEVRIQQLIGRAIRQCSHRDLPMNERSVEIYRYKVTRKNGKLTTDEEIEELAKGKENLISSFTQPVKEVAVDCELNKNINMMDNDYKCFKFDEPSLFEKHIGPAYKDDIYYDLKIDNGSNSNKSINKKVKVIKIKGVKKIGDEKYGPAENYWYNTETGVVYDYDLDFQVGKVYIDENKIPNKLDKDTYIIDYVIPIPLLRKN